MADSHVVSALKEKRARLAGELISTRIKAIALQTDLDHVDACLRVFRAGIDPAQIEPKRTNGKSPASLPKGTGTRTALDILRETGEAFTAMVLAACVLQRHERPLEPRALDMMAKNLHANFSRRKDRVVEFDRDSYPGKWRLTS
jgi:hypothetical protein